jgi:hypothetical protein
MIHLLAQRGLGDVKEKRGARDAAVFDDAHEIFQLTHFHDAPLAPPQCSGLYPEDMPIGKNNILQHH